MRPITKIFLLLVAAFVAYLLWPRTPSLRGFAPRELAKLRVESWQNERGSSGLGAVFTVFRIYSSQFGFSPVTSFQIAQSEVSAEKMIQKSGKTKLGDDLALVPLQEKYALIERSIGKEVKADACARGELGWRTLEAEGGDSEVVAKSLAALLACEYGGNSDEFLAASRQITGARSVLFGAKLPNGYDDPQRAALELATDGYEQISAIVGHGEAASGR